MHHVHSPCTSHPHPFIREQLERGKCVISLSQGSPTKRHRGLLRFTTARGVQSLCSGRDQSSSLQNETYARKLHFDMAPRFVVQANSNFQRTIQSRHASAPDCPQNEDAPAPGLQGFRTFPLGRVGSIATETRQHVLAVPSFEDKMVFHVIGSFRFQGAFYGPPRVPYIFPAHLAETSIREVDDIPRWIQRAFIQAPPKKTVPWPPPLRINEPGYKM
mmetsp:Transcript_7002/g.10342  ORF Transcript_7002/g.10342 Transcript_7002/m.10342 type:complete len:217 (+) Transcript_7002:601-1251(+)